MGGGTVPAGGDVTPVGGGTAERGSPPGRRIAVRERLTAADASLVLRLADAAAAADGSAPLSEHVMLHLRYGGDPRARNLLAFEGADLAGYAHLDPTDPVEGPSGELVIHPRFRRRGIGRLLAGALVMQADGRPVRLWAHGDLPVATRLAAAAGFERARSLWQMRRSLRAPLGQPVFADGITVRTFVVGRDEPAWIELNRRAFSRHPEQGAWTREDLDKRERETWFDPDGFFLAERDGRLVGFHWTKIHGGGHDGEHGDGAGHEDGGESNRDRSAGHTDGGAGHRDASREDDGAGHRDRSAGHSDGAGHRDSRAGPGDADAGAGAGSGGHGHEAIGEVYVVGVDPTEQGTGLGRALTVTGLRYLRSRGLSEAMLYVDESNTRAIRLYESLGFTHSGTDVMFRHPGSRRKPPP